MPMLEIQGLSVSYGGLAAVKSMSMSADSGQLVGLIGPNGAGKTTVLDALSGFVTAKGRIVFDGQPIDGLPPHERARRGLVRTWQSVELFDDLSVAENLQVAAERPSPFSAVRDLIRPPRPRPHALAARALELLQLEHLADRMPSDLSQGQRKLVGVARALAGRPRILLLDEPAAGLDTDESRQFGSRLATLASEGIGVVLIDHDMGLVLSTCTEVHVLDFGQIIASGTPAEIRANRAVIAAYLGDEAVAADAPAQLPGASQ